MKKTCLLAVLGCAVIASAAFANINLQKFSNKLLATNLAGPTQRVEFVYPGHNTLYISSSKITFADYKDGKCVNAQSFSGDSGNIKTNVPLYITGDDFVSSGLTGDKCVTIEFTDFAGTQIDHMVAMYDNNEKQYTEINPSSVTFNIQ